MCDLCYVMKFCNFAVFKKLNVIENCSCESLTRGGTVYGHFTGKIDLLINFSTTNLS